MPLSIPFDGRAVLGLLLFVSAFLLPTREARAETLAAPFGGKPLLVPDGRIACGVAGGWTVGADRRSLKPPADEAAVGQKVELAVAPNDAACAGSKDRLTLITTGPWPWFESGSVVVMVDDARIEARGKHLRGVRVAWAAANGQHGDDVCLSPQPDGGGERCVWSLGTGLPADPSALALTWGPAGAPPAPDEILFDAEGRRATPDAERLPISRIAVSSVVRPNAALDAALGTGTLALRHPEGVLGADCPPASCAVDAGSIVVGLLPASMSTVSIRVKLAPRVVLRTGDAVEASPVVRVPVMRCPLSVASGPLLRDTESQRVVLRVEGRCASEIDHLRFLVGQAPAVRERTVADGAAALVVLRVARIDADDVPVAVVREEGEGFAVAQTLAHSQELPTVHVALEMEGGRAIDFVPTNVDASARVVAPTWDGIAEVVAVPGSYSVTTPAGATVVRGAALSGGSIALRISLERDLPAPMGRVEIARVTETAVRGVRKANVPATIVGGASGPLAEVVCDEGKGAEPVAVGGSAHVPFVLRDSCRLVLHRERLDPRLGTQKLALDVDVTRVDGAPRSEARISRTVTLEPATTSRLLWLRGAEARFDRYSVRLTHVADDRHYDVATDTDSGLPSAQWSVITGRGFGRLYATTAIPTGMYRVADRDHSGILTLNFGVVARLTWLDSLGHEGILALETGVMAVGLANDTSPTGRSLTQVATVAGLGLSVPIANRGLATETAVNLHAWFEYEPSRAMAGEPGSAMAFVFGPSISIGNLGTDL